MPMPPAMVPGGPGPVGQTTPPGQPAFGPSPQVTSPVPNEGHKAAGMAFLAQAVRLLEKAIPMLGAESNQGREAVQALGKLARTLPAGSTSQGQEHNALRNMMMEQQQQNPMLALMRQKMQQGGVGQPSGQSPAPPPM
ncbi:hypothetical protein KGP36_06115 [Patescibacteria group bacterium]|nr:hypothetical protein [Patescibacteria group bacterium]